MAALGRAAGLVAGRRPGLSRAPPPRRPRIYCHLGAALAARPRVHVDRRLRLRLRGQRVVRPGARDSALGPGSLEVRQGARRGLEAARVVVVTDHGRVDGDRDVDVDWLLAGVV